MGYVEEFAVIEDGIEVIQKGVPIFPRLDVEVGS